MTPYILGHLRLGRIDPVEKLEKLSRMGQDAGSDLCFEVSSRDRIAPDCAIRHPVWQTVALQRRVRFSARLVGFRRSRWHQRRAIRAERASLSVFVSNLDFRVPRLRQIGERALNGPCGSGKEATREAQNRGRGYCGVAGASTFGTKSAWASFMSLLVSNLASTRVRTLLRFFPGALLPTEH